MPANRMTVQWEASYNREVFQGSSVNTNISEYTNLYLCLNQSRRDALKACGGKIPDTLVITISKELLP